MKNQNENLIDQLIELIVLGGGLYLIYKILFSEESTKNKYPAILGPPNARKITGINDRFGNDLLISDLLASDPNHATEIIRLLNKGRMFTQLPLTLYKTLPGFLFSGELRDKGKGWRILIYELSPKHFIAVSFFLKKTQKLPKNEITKAENRIKEFLKYHGSK